MGREKKAERKRGKEERKGIENKKGRIKKMLIQEAERRGKR